MKNHLKKLLKTKKKSKEILEAEQPFLNNFPFVTGIFLGSEYMMEYFQKKLSMFS